MNRNTDSYYLSRPCQYLVKTILLPHSSRKRQCAVAVQLQCWGGMEVVMLVYTNTSPVRPSSSYSCRKSESGDRSGLARQECRVCAGVTRQFRPATPPPSIKPSQTLHGQDYVSSVSFNLLSRGQTSDDSFPCHFIHLAWVLTSGAGKAGDSEG